MRPATSAIVPAALTTAAASGWRAVAGVRDLGLIRGFKAVKLWLKEVCGFRRKPPVAAPA